MTHPSKPVQRASSRTADEWDPWWQRSPLFRRDEYGQYTSRPGAEFWYEHFWKPRALSAWAYELCRRLRKLPKQQKLQLTKTDRAILKCMPTYPRLASTQKQLLQAIFSTQFDKIWPVFHPQSDSQESWKQGQPAKLGDWRQIEELDLAFDQQDTERRHSTKEYMRRFWPLLRAACQFLFANEPGGSLLHSVSPPNHELSGWQFTPKQFEQALESAGLSSRKIAKRRAA